jgi:hypothetical protein
MGRIHESNALRELANAIGKVLIAGLAGGFDGLLK